MAVVLARAELDVGEDWAFGHYTHEKNPVMSRAGLTTLQIIDDEGLVDRSAELGRHALARARAIADRHPEVVGDVRGRGLMLGIELVDPTTGGGDQDLAESVLYGALRRGLSFKTTMGNVLTLAPALTITQDQLDEAFDVLDASFAEALGA